MTEVWSWGSSRGSKLLGLRGIGLAGWGAGALGIDFYLHSATLPA